MHHPRITLATEALAGVGWGPRSLGQGRAQTAKSCTVTCVYAPGAIPNERRRRRRRRSRRTGFYSESHEEEESHCIVPNFRGHSDSLSRGSGAGHIMLLSTVWGAGVISVCLKTRWVIFVQMCFLSPGMVL
jgi:hypothetical protein